MKEIKLTGREMAALKAIDYSTGSTGAEISAHTHIDETELLDVLNGLTDIGYVEAYPAGSECPLANEVQPEAFTTTRFEINPSYALQLKEAMRR
jgi:hypothetical protein